ncbi:MAG: hypothetical protein V3V78_01030 [Candidatus Woesearchaeota archaeon]
MSKKGFRNMNELLSKLDPRDSSLRANMNFISIHIGAYENELEELKGTDNEYTDFLQRQCKIGDLALNQLNQYGSECILKAQERVKNWVKPSIKGYGFDVDDIEECRTEKDLYEKLNPFGSKEENITLLGDLFLEASSAGRITPIFRGMIDNAAEDINECIIDPIEKAYRERFDNDVFEFCKFYKDKEVLKENE